MKNKQPPKISVCIPVFETEPYLAQCLNSVLLQNFDSFEVIVVSDASTGCDEKGRKAEKIIKAVSKVCNKIRKKNSQNIVPVRFIENEKNRGIFEVRRTLTNSSQGEYLCFVDSDDELAADALEILYNSHLSSDGKSYDIIQGSSVTGTFENEVFIPAEKNLYLNITFGELKDHQIFHTWLVEGNLTGILWAKLLKRELVEQAYNQIPYTECNMADDILLFFFIAQIAKSYFGINKCVYKYRMNSGMSSERKIDSLQKWKLVCSSASVFTIISQCENIKDKEELECLKKEARAYLLLNIQNLKRNVVPELQKEAYTMLCDWWGEDFVKTIETLADSQIN